MTETTQPVPLFTLARQWPEIRDRVLAAVDGVYASQQFILGGEVAALERECAEVLGVRRAIGVSSGTDALLVALMALGVGPGDEVITSPFTFFATAGVVHRLGARPVFADIRPADYNLDPEKVAAAITPRTKAVIPVHLYGQACDMKGLQAAVGDIPLVEDCCQAIATPYQGTMVGGLGRIGCFSFFPTKNLGAFGDAGLVTTNDEILGDLLTDLRVHGMRTRYYHHSVGGNFRLDALQAVILRVKLPHLTRWIAARRAGAAHYGQLFAAAGMEDLVAPPAELPGRGHTYHQYVVRVPKRDELRQFLADRGVGTEVYYPVCLHQQECFAYLRYRAGDFPVSEQAAREVLALPIFPELRSDERERVVREMAAFFGR